MAKFSSFEKQGAKQAASIMKALQGNSIKSVGTVRNYEQALSQFCTFLASQGLHIRDVGKAEAISYLEQRAEEVGQKTLDLDRQAIQAALMHTGAIQERLAVIKSEHQQVLEARAYTPEQVSMVAERQTEKHALATEIAHAAGLRAHELLTLAPATERPADIRPALESKFEGREGVLYTVEGKGGLCREVMLPKDLADRLEDRRLTEPKQVTDRGVHYEQRYDIGAGNVFSASFSRASDRALDWSNGAHGLRHSYAIERMNELQSRGYDRDTALETVSQEMGHFRPDITEIYLR
jgi:integrase